MKRINTKFLIVGRSATGKSLLSRLLENQGFKTQRSYTTSSPKNLYDYTHIFITEEEYNSIGNKMLRTEHAGFKYFYTSEQLNDFDFLVVDPEGVRDLLRYKKEYNYIVVLIETSTEIKRNEAFMYRIAVKNESEREEAFENREKSDNYLFDDFKEWLFRESGDTDSEISSIIYFQNNYEIGSLLDLSSLILQTYRKMYNIQTLFDRLVEDKDAMISIYGREVDIFNNSIDKSLRNSYIRSLYSDESSLLRFYEVAMSTFEISSFN